MASFNRVIMMGNLTRDPDYKQLASGQSLCRLGLASNRQFKNKQTGMMAQEVCFVDIDVWGPQADSCNQYLQKGRPILVEGRLKLDSWVDNEGQKRSRHSIVADRVTFLSGAAQAEESESFGQNTTAVTSEPSFKTDNSVSQEVSINQEKVAKPKKKTSPVTASSYVKTTEDKTAGSEEGITETGEINFKDEEPFEDDLPF